MLTKEQKKKLESLIEQYGLDLILVAYSYSLLDLDEFDGSDEADYPFDKQFYGDNLYFDDVGLPGTIIDELRELGMYDWEYFEKHYHDLPHTLLEMGFVEIAARTAEMNRWIDERLANPD